jgi:aspartyl-tRNA(Asn)/glutamyl-tRNA(Gln) amidotransferase subunit A
MLQDITEDILFSPIRALGDLLRKRKITSTALTEAYLQRLDKLGPKLGAVVTITRELALKEAAAADKELAAGKDRGPLHGIPYGAKDLLATKGIPTTWGAEPYKTQVFDHDATVIRRLREAGAVLAAKLAMVELAGAWGYNNADASFTGPGRTPWNLDFWSGGSSSGPGAAMAAGLVAFTIGSETSGSIVTPAAFCGVAGLRPTYGRVSRHGAMALSWTMDKLGPMCRCAEDCGLVLAAIAGKDPHDATTSGRQFVYPPTETGSPKKDKWKIGIIKNATATVQPAVRKNFEESVKVLRTLADVEDNVPFPDLPFNEAVGTIIKAEGASAFRDLLDSGKAQTLRAVNDRWGGYTAAMVLAIDYLQAMRLRGTMKKALDELCAGYDALIAPAVAVVAYPIDRDFDKAYPGFGGGPPIIPAGNIAGQPALVVPNGWGDNDLPTAIQFTGRVWSEARLLELGAAYEKAADPRLRTRRPTLKGGK